MRCSWSAPPEVVLSDSKSGSDAEAVAVLLQRLLSLDDDAVHHLVGPRVEAVDGRGLGEPVGLGAIVAVALRRAGLSRGLLLVLDSLAVLLANDLAVDDLVGARVVGRDVDFSWGPRTSAFSLGLPAFLSSRRRGASLRVAEFAQCNTAR